LKLCYKTYLACLLFYGTVFSVSAQVKKDSVSISKIYETLELMPEFPGGIVAMEKYVVQHLNLPVLKSAPPKGGVYTRFLVKSDGSITDIKIARSCGNVEIDDSVKAVIRRMPLWKPGMYDGKPVNCYYNLPISYINYK